MGKSRKVSKKAKRKRKLQRKRDNYFNDANYTSKKSNNLDYFPDGNIDFDEYSDCPEKFSGTVVDTGIEGFADMHVHSEVPDSYRPLDDVFNEALKRGLSYIGITDHNYNGPDLGIGRYCRQNNISDDEIIIRAFDGKLNICPGAEVNTYHKGSKFHVTVFGISRNQDLPVNKFIRLEHERTFMIRSGHFAFLKEFGFRFDEKNISDYWVKLTRENPDFCDFRKEDVLKYIKIYHTQEDFLKANKILPSGYNYNFQGFNFDTADLIKLTHDAGGIVNIAHPRLSNKSSNAISAFNSLVNHGLDGVEMYNNEASILSKLKGTAKERAGELLVSAGSDKHYNDRHLGRKGKNGVTILAKYMSILTKLEEINANRKTLNIAQMNEDYKVIEEKYMPTFNQLKIEFIRDTLLKMSSAYSTEFNINVNKLIKYDKFCLLYFNYLLSNEVGSEHLSPIKQISAIGIEEWIKITPLKQSESYGIRPYKEREENEKIFTGVSPNEKIPHKTENKHKKTKNKHQRTYEHNYSYNNITPQETNDTDLYENFKNQALQELKDNPKMVLRRAVDNYINQKRKQLFNIQELENMQKNICSKIPETNYYTNSF